MTINNKNKIKVLYVFAGQRKVMEDDWHQGIFPDTYFIGMNHLHLFGIDAEYIETNLMNRLRKINFNLANVVLLFKIRKYDIVFTGASIFFIFLTKVILKFSKPKFVYYNTSLTNLYKRNNKGIRRFIVKKTIMSMDGIVCPSLAQKEFLIANGFNSNKIFFVPNGVDVDFINSKIRSINKKSDERFILSVGKDMGRDYQTLIEAVKGLDINLKIVASSRNINFTSDLPSNVSFQNLPFIDLLRLYKDCEFIIIPTKNEDYLNASDCSGQYVLLDAMASSRAVIASKRQALNDYFIDGVNGILVDPENPLSLRIAIEKLLNDNNLKYEMGKRSFEMSVNKFTTKKFAENLSKIFFKIVDKNG